MDVEHRLWPVENKAQGARSAWAGTRVTAIGAAKKGRTNTASALTDASIPSSALEVACSKLRGTLARSRLGFWAFPCPYCFSVLPLALFCSQPNLPCPLVLPTHHLQPHSTVTEFHRLASEVHP